MTDGMIIGIDGIGEGNNSGDNKADKQKTGRAMQEQIHGLLFNDRPSWQSIIYDLINTEQLNPMDIDISLLANKYLDKVKALEEADFFVSAKVLFAASWLLRLKSEILLNQDIPALDEILFGKKEERRYVQERIELDEEIPELIVKTPLPRFRKVTLQELMASLGKAISTETRRIKRVILSKQYEREAAIALPKNKINIRDKIRDVYNKLLEVFKTRETKLAFSELAGSSASAEERISTFIPLLHLDYQHRVWLEQNAHLDEIWILLKHIYEKQNAALLEVMRKEVEAEMEKLDENLTDEERARAEKIEKEFDKPIGEV